MRLRGISSIGWVPLFQGPKPTQTMEDIGHWLIPSPSRKYSFFPSVIPRAVDEVEFSFLGALDLVQHLYTQSYPSPVFPSPGWLRSLSFPEWEALFSRQWSNSFFVSFHLVKEYSWTSSVYQRFKSIPSPRGLRLPLTVLIDTFCLNLEPDKNLTNAWTPGRNSYPLLFSAMARLS